MTIRFKVGKDVEGSCDNTIKELSQNLLQGYEDNHKI
jgi:hypothetical protein